jgi:4-hydroxybenzoate polyprenyltransferase
MSSQGAALVESLRPKQWAKNLLVFVGLVFGEQLGRGDMRARALLAFILFCAASSAVYLANDLADISEDRRHPDKRHRPLPSGRLRPRVARAAALALALGSLAGAAALGEGFLAIIASYLALSALYSWRLKHIVVVDLFVLTAGFLLRAAGGAVVVGVAMSNWLLLCTTFLALFVGIHKRRHELMAFGSSAHNHRPVLGEYSGDLLDQMSSVVTACTVICYALYTVDPATLAKFPHGELLKYTLVCVLFGVFRYMHLVYNCDVGSKPEQVLLSDVPTLVNMAIFLAIVSAVIYL